MKRIPRSMLYKSPHLTLSLKGLKGYTRKQNVLVIKTKENAMLTPEQREVCRRICSKSVRQAYGSLNIRFFTNLSRSKKPLQTRMGKGKGKPDNWVAPVRKGLPLLEIGGPVRKKITSLIFHRLSHRLPVFIKKLPARCKINAINEKIKIKKC